MKKINIDLNQELLDMGMKMDQAIGHVWTGNTKKEQMGNMAKIVKGGHFAILSSCWFVGLVAMIIDL